MKKLSKKLNWFIITYGIIICLCFLLIVLDYCNAFSKMGGASSRFNWGFISVIASFFCGFSSVLAVFFTIWTEKNSRQSEWERQDSIRKQEQERFDNARREEEKKKAMPYFQGMHSVIQEQLINIVELLIGEKPYNKTYQLITLTDAIGIIKEIHYGGKCTPLVPNMQKAIGKNILLKISSSMGFQDGDFLVAEDIYGHQYKYTLQAFSETEISVGLPQPYDPTDTSTVSDNK